MKLFANSAGELKLVNDVMNKISNVIFLKLYISLINHNADIRRILSYEGEETYEFALGDDSPHILAFVHSGINKIISNMNSTITVTKPFIGQFIDEVNSKKNLFFHQYSPLGGYMI